MSACKQATDVFARAPSCWQFHDVYGTNPELLAFVPTPVLAVMLLFPVSVAAKQTATESVAKVNADGQVLSDKVWFCKQRITNACGTVGVLHALMNADDLEKDGWLKKFAENTAGKDPEARAEVLEGDNELHKCHADAAEQGQTRPPPIDEVVKRHFVVMIQKDGCLYELDGRCVCVCAVVRVYEPTPLPDTCSPPLTCVQKALPAQLGPVRAWTIATACGLDDSGLLI